MTADAGTQKRPLEPDALDQLFLSARTYMSFLPRPIPPGTLKTLYALLRMAPTAQNCQPARFVFVVSPEAKERLLPCVMAGNRSKVESAPVTAIIATDTRFYDQLPRLWHDPSARDTYAKAPKLAHDTAFRSACLQGAYLIMAARALGLDCGPMSGFDPAAVNDAMLDEYPGWEANFLCNIGYGDPTTLYPRAGRLDFDNACRVI